MLTFNDKIFVAGHNGLVGSGFVRRLNHRGYKNILTSDRSALDLTDANKVNNFFKDNRPKAVIIAAARVGGIRANSTYPAEFIRENLLIQTNLMEASRVFGVTDLLFLSSSCVYPKEAPQPMVEDSLMTGPIEQTNAPYAFAKLAGMEMAKAYSKQYGVRYFSVIPATIYGPNENFDLENSHVLPALVRRFHEAALSKQSEISIWGSGFPKREFMYVDDACDAMILALEKYTEVERPLNIGIGYDTELRHLVNIIQELTGFKGQINFDTTKPDGMLRKFVDSARLFKMGFKPTVELHEGLRNTYDWFLKSPHVRGVR